MLFLANRANLDKRTLLTRIHNHLQTRVETADSPVEQVRYHPSTANKIGVRATINAPAFLGTRHPVEQAELQVAFDFPPKHPYDCYSIQWVESERDLMIRWQQEETHIDLGECHFEIDYRGEPVQREPSAFLDAHPLNVLETRIEHLETVLNSFIWEDDPTVPAGAIH
ncbi:MAG: hypothetical protein ABEH59_12320 [Halobacteriales archaeon]